MSQADQKARQFLERFVGEEVDDKTVRALADALSMLGAEVKAIRRIGGNDQDRRQVRV